MSRTKFDPDTVSTLLFSLRQKLGRRYKHVDGHLLDASIEDAVLHYLKCPEKFDASRSVPLLSYLTPWVRSFLDKKLLKVKRRRRHEKAAGVSEKKFEKIVSEVRARKGIYIGRDRGEQEAEEREERLETQRAILKVLIERLPPRDLTGVQLLLAGTSLKEWVLHLGIEHLPRKQQQNKVNTEKERLKTKLKRWAQKMNGGGG